MAKYVKDKKSFVDAINETASLNKGVCIMTLSDVGRYSTEYLGGTRRLRTYFDKDGDIFVKIFFDDPNLSLDEIGNSYFIKPLKPDYGIMEGVKFNVLSVTSMPNRKFSLTYEEDVDKDLMKFEIEVSKAWVIKRKVG